MPDDEGLVTVALDFDETAAEGEPLQWRRGALDLILGAGNAGVRIVVHSCRSTAHVEAFGGGPAEVEEFQRTGSVPEGIRRGWGMRAEMLQFLEAEGALSLVEIWEGPGKPLADHYADNKAQGADLVLLCAELGIVALPGHKPKVAAPAPVLQQEHGSGLASQVGPGGRQGPGHSSP